MLITPWPFQLMLAHVPSFEVISTHPQQWQGQGNSMCLISIVVTGPKYYGTSSVLGNSRPEVT